MSGATGSSGASALLEPEPSAAATLFADRVPLARSLTARLAGSAVDEGLVGPREVPRMWSRHVLNCAVVGELVPPGARVVDVGSGAGLPGLVLAVRRPDLEIVLVEPMERRCRWLRETGSALGVDVTVLRARAEDVAPGSAEVVTARAVAPLDRLARWCLPLLRPEGVLLALKGRSAADELARSASALRRAGATAEVLTCGDGVLDVPTTVVRVRVGPGRSAAHGRREGRREE